MSAKTRALALVRPPGMMLVAVVETLWRRARRGRLRPTWRFRDEAFVAFMRHEWRHLWRWPAPEIRAYLDALPTPRRFTRRVRREHATIGGVAGQWFIPPEAPERTPLLVYFHGGSFQYGSVHSHGDVIARLALRTGFRTFVPDYRLAPEHPFPAAADDALAVVRALRQHGVQVALAGDSAGGALAIGVGLSCVAAGEAPPPATAAFAPWLDLEVRGDSYERFAALDFGPREMLATQGRAYAGARAPSDPALSLCHAEPRGLGPLLLQVGSIELLHDEVVAFAGRARAAGVDVTLDVLTDMPHASTNLAAYLPEGDRAVTRAAEFLRSRLA